MSRWPAPAKLNLFLHVTGRRADGYHELQTAFQFLDFGDELVIEPRSDGRIVRRHELAGVPAEADLSVRAAQALARRAGRAVPGCDIELHKRIPLGAGLGGGSSDAATTLVALDRLWKLDLGEEVLAQLGLALGADVPVFVRGRAAWAEGIGERLAPIAPPEAWFLVVVPPCHVDTRDMYAAPELRRDAPRITADDWLAGRARAGNDFEPVVRRRFPPVAEALEALAALPGAGAPRLSGSGAAVFADFASRDAAARAQAALPASWRSFVARGCNRSPLQLALQSGEAR